MTQLVRYDVGDAVATITLDSPHNKNALSRQLLTELFAHLEAAERDDAVKAVVIAAAGNVFCSGADLSEAAEGAMEEGARTLVRLQRTIAACPKPVVTRVQGAVRAGGIGIVAASDIAIGTRSSSYALTEVRLGLAAAAISLTVLPRLTDRAASLTALTGDTFGGDCAAEIGLLTRVVPDDELELEVHAVVESLLKGHPQGLRETKRLLNAPLLERIDSLGEDVAVLSARLFGSEVAREAMAAFLGRRR